MLAYFKDTSAKILRVQISKCTDAIPQDTFHASLETHARSWPSRGRPVDHSAKRSAGRTEATTKMHEAA